jgi:hypothetical protein
MVEQRKRTKEIGSNSDLKASDWLARSKAKSRGFELSGHCRADRSGHLWIAAWKNVVAGFFRFRVVFARKLCPSNSRNVYRTCTLLVPCNGNQREHSKHDIADGHAAHQETTEEPLPVMTFPVDHSFFMMQGAK